MDEKIKYLYELAGVDTSGLEHKVRLRWNEMTSNERLTFVETIGRGVELTYDRWDRLPQSIRERLLAVTQRRQKAKSRWQRRKVKPEQ